MADGAGLLWILLFSSVGLGYFLYGKKQKMVTPLISGVALMIYPYFVAHTIVLIVTGLALIAIPYFFRF